MSGAGAVFPGTTEAQPVRAGAAPVSYTPRDARPALIAAAAAGICVWQYSPPALIAAVLVIFLLVIRQPDYVRKGRGIVRQARRFAVGMGMVKAGFDLLGGVEASTALFNGALITGRLLGAVGIGLALFLYCGPRGLCLAMTWYLRPLLGKRAWRVGLAAALVVHFLPMVFLLVHECTRQIRFRLPQANYFRRLGILARAVLRQLAQKTWSQSAALVARGLDTAQPWTQHGLPGALPLLKALLAGALAVALLYVPNFFSV